MLQIFLAWPLSNQFPSMQIPQTQSAPHKGQTKVLNSILAGKFSICYTDCDLCVGLTLNAEGVIHHNVNIKL